MKRKILAWTAAILILAAVSACFLRPAPRERDVYYLSYNSWTPPENLSGDTQFFDEIGVMDWATVSYPSLRMHFKPKDENIQLHMGMGEFTDFGTQDYMDLRGDYEWGPYGYAEHLENGEWAHFCDIGVGYPSSGYAPEDDFFRYREEIPDNVHIYFNFPTSVYDKPGRYRVTFFFREYTVTGASENGKPRYTTGDDLYSISFELDSPERTNEPYQIVQISGQRSYYRFPVMSIFLRRNIGETGLSYPDFLYLYPYIDPYSFVLEKEADGSFETVPPREGYPIPAFIQNRGGGGDVQSEYTVVYTISLYYPSKEFDFDAVYRLTMTFTENKDGSGEQYTISFKFKFDE